MALHVCLQLRYSVLGSYRLNGRKTPSVEQLIVVSRILLVLLQAHTSALKWTFAQLFIQGVCNHFQVSRRMHLKR